jgi:LuxR family maltose regulon positive regulatory protein
VASILESSAPITVVVAPAGYGKTTLLCETAEAIGASVVWVNLDPGDNDAVRLWTHVAAGLDAVGADGSLVRAALVGGARPVDAVVAVVESFEDAVTLVLDDAHELLDDAVRDGCTQLITHPPTNLRVLVSSRAELDWSVTRLVTIGQLDRLDDTALALLGDAGIAVLQPEVDAGSISANDARTIVERVEGWPAGLRLAKLAIAGGGNRPDLVAAIAGDQPTIARYLANEVFATRSVAEQEFLLATSVLDMLTPEACDAVTGRSNSLGVLHTLVNDHVFTTICDPAGPVFAYHRLLGEFLQARLAQRGTDAVTAVHQRALDHAIAVDDTGAVVRHAVAADRSEVAMERLAEEYLKIANDGRIAELWMWVGMIGPEHVLAHPVLSSTPAWASLNLGRFDEIEPWLESFALLDDPSPQHASDFALHAAALRCHRDRHLGRLDAATAHGLDLIDRLADATTQIASSNALAAAGAALALSGESDPARALLKRAIRIGMDIGEPSAVVMAHNYLALIATDRETANHHVACVFDVVDSPELERFHIPAAAWLTRARGSIDDGRVADAADELDQALWLAQAGREPLLEILIALQQARRFHLVGDDENRRAELRRAETLLEEASGAGWLIEQLQATRAATRFSPRDDANLRIGARDLSERELAVLRLLPHDLSRKQLARQLYVSENTIKTHLTSIRHKLGVRERSAMVDRARVLGMIDG